ncbi:crossover junction endodeoxyribonuclease RuvC [Candidatus Berkelbacteria bacterium]|nr:crossover junction endodeoxyribonuclease RuvC [Candidatus Berkelbacteria bacterium]
MKILGIDPGTATTGFGLIETNGEVESFKLHHFGWIRTDKEDLRENRLLQIYDQMFTVMSVSEARGVAMLAISRYKIPLFSYAPLEMKFKLTGSGKATKKEVQETVRKIFHLEKAPKPDDAADAIAIALCHLKTKSERQKAKSDN